MPEPRMDEEEILEPISLSGEAGSTRKSTSRFRGGFLMLLLGLWTLGVYGFLTREGDAVVVGNPPAAREDMEEETEITQEVQPVDVPVRVPALELKEPDRVRVASEPSAASVLVDGIFVGMTPLEIERPESGQRLDFRKSGYEPEQVTGDAWREGTDVTVRLTPITAPVRFSVSPTRATLWVDGTELKLPEDGVVELPMRPHRIKATAPGYEDMEINVLPAIAYEREVVFDLRERSE